MRTSGIQFLRSQRTRWLDYVAFVVHPVHFDAIKLRTLAGRVTGQDTSAATGLLRRAAVLPQPVSHFFVVLLGGVVSDHEQRLLAQLVQLLATHGRLLCADGANGWLSNEAQPNLFGQRLKCPRPRDQQAVVDPRLFVWIILGYYLFD